MTDGVIDELARAGRFSVRYGEEVIVYALRLQPLRQPSRVAIHVEASGRVLVDAPVGATHASVVQAVKKRAGWIAQHVAQAKARLEHVRHRDYTSGETVHYLGRRYRLRVTVDPSAAASCRLRGGFLEVTVHSRTAQDVQVEMSAWVRHRASEVLHERLDTIAAGLRWVKIPPPMRLQWMRVQWGSCSPHGRITADADRLTRMLLDARVHADRRFALMSLVIIQGEPSIELQLSLPHGGFNAGDAVIEQGDVVPFGHERNLVLQIGEAIVDGRGGQH